MADALKPDAAPPAEVTPDPPRLGRGRIKGFKHPLDKPFELAGFQKSKGLEVPVSRMIINIWPDKPYFVWHPSGPDYEGLMFGNKFTGGRIPGAVPGRTAELLKAMGCRVEDYIPGMDIADWNPVETGGFEPKFTTDKEPTEKPELTTLPQCPSGEGEDMCDTVISDECLDCQEPVTERIHEPKAEDKPQDYSLLDKDALKALCLERGLEVDKRSVAKMLKALEESDR